MKTSEILALSPEELGKRLDETYRELFNLRFQKATRQLAKTSELRRVKRDIARLHTILTQKERQL